MKIKGNSLLSVFDFLENRAGAGAREAVVERLPEETRRSLRPVLASNWYPVETLCELLEAGRAHTGDEDFIRASGRHNAEFGTTGVYQNLLRPGDPMGTIQWSARLWHVLCDEGSPSLEQVGEHEAVLRVESFPAPAALRERLLGFYTGLVELAGGKRVEVEEVPGEDAESFVLRLRWA